MEKLLEVPETCEIQIQTETVTQPTLVDFESMYAFKEPSNEIAT